MIERLTSAGKASAGKDRVAECGAMAVVCANAKGRQRAKRVAYDRFRIGSGLWKTFNFIALTETGDQHEFALFAR